MSVFDEQVREAVKEFQVDRVAGGAQVRIVESNPGNGSRCVVSVAHHDQGGPILGGEVLVTVHYPWQRAYALSSGGVALAWDYAMEKFGRPDPRGMNGGDMYAVARTIAEATGRTLFGHPTPEEAKQDA